MRFHVPRLAAFRMAGDLTLRYARLVVAREYGFPQLARTCQTRRRRAPSTQHSAGGCAGAAFELIRAGDVRSRPLPDADPGLVRAELTGASATMLEAIAQPLFGDTWGLFAVSIHGSSSC